MKNTCDNLEHLRLVHLRLVHLRLSHRYIIGSVNRDESNNLPPLAAHLAQQSDLCPCKRLILVMVRHGAIRDGLLGGKQSSHFDACLSELHDAVNKFFVRLRVARNSAWGTSVHSRIASGALSKSHAQAILASRRHAAVLQVQVRAACERCLRHARVPLALRAACARTSYLPGGLLSARRR